MYTFEVAFPRGICQTVDLPFQRGDMSLPVLAILDLDDEDGARLQRFGGDQLRDLVREIGEPNKIAFRCREQGRQD